jgi:hypothetical protein
LPYLKDILRRQLDPLGDSPAVHRFKRYNRRGTAYYKPRPVSNEDLLLMRKLDELHLNYPFAGSRMLRDLLRQQGHAVGQLHIGTLMREMVSRRSTAGRTPPNPRQDTGFIPICYGIWR